VEKKEKVEVEMVVETLSTSLTRIATTMTQKPPRKFEAGTQRQRPQ